MYHSDIRFVRSIIKLMGGLFSLKLKVAWLMAYQDVLINELAAGGTTLLGARLAGLSKSLSV